MKNQSLHAGTVIGSYRLIHLLGFGPASFVYLARPEDASAERVVLKLIDTESTHISYQQQFLQEVSHISRLRHPSLLPFLSANFYGDTPYVVQSYVENGSLFEHLSGIPPRLLPLERTLNILQQVGEALSLAHRFQIVHANLKPENILWLDRERVALTDFRLHTLANITRTARQRTAKAACYMAPEQFQGIATPLSDQYAFACLAYELLTGQPPFTAADFKTLAYKHTVEPPLPPGLQNARLPRYLDPVLLKALEKWPDDRYPDMQAFLADLIHHHSSSAPFPVVRQRARPQLAQDSSKHAVTPALVLPQRERTNAQRPLPPVTDKSPAIAPAPSKRPFPVRLRQFTQALFAHLLKLSETALLATLVFLFDRLKKCRELLSLLKLFFSVLKERRAEVQPEVRTRAGELWEKFETLLARAWAALCRMRPVARARRRRLVRPARISSLSTLPLDFPHAPRAQNYSAVSSTIPAKPFWTRRRLLITGSVGLACAGFGLSYLTYHLLSTNRSATVALMSQALMPASMRATATPGPVLPTRAISLLVFTQHQQTVRSVAWSPDGTLLASGADDRLLLTWDLAASVHLRCEQNAAVNAIAWAPASPQLALAAANQVIFLDTKLGIQEAGDAFTHKSTVTSLAWSRQQPRLLVSGGLDKLAVIWDTWTFQPQLIFRQHTAAIHSASWASDGQTVGTCSEGGVTRIWNANNGKQLHGLFLDREGVCTSLAFEPGGTRLAVGEGDGVLRIWQNSLICRTESSGNRQGICLDTPTRLRAHTGAIRAVAWSPQGKLLASAGDDGALLIWEPDQRQTPLLKISHAAPVLAISWSPDGKKLAAASGNTVTLWELS